MLKLLLQEHGITQADLARGIERSEPFVSMLISRSTSPSMETVGRVLAFLSERLGRKVAFEEAFGDITAAPTEGDGAAA